jgi:LuxR family maltose regulon positive regulatory protein
LAEVLRTAAASPDARPLIVITWRMAEWGHLFLAFQPGEALLQVAAAFHAANASGVHVVDYFLHACGALSALTANECGRARDHLRAARLLVDPSRPVLHAMHGYLAAWCALALGQTADAVTHGDAALRLATTIGGPSMEAMCRQVLAQAYAAVGRGEEASREVERIRAIALQLRFPWLEYTCLLTSAQFALAGRDEVKAGPLLAQALALGRSYGFRVMAGWLSRPMTRLWAFALERGIEVAHVQELIRSAPSAFGPPPMGVEAWPWAVKVYTLGRFAVLVAGKPLRFSTKAQKKPLELLKVLIAFGGKHVPESKVAEALWPGRDTEAAFRSLASAIHRLRKLIGDASIERQQGHLTLSPRDCWTDLWAVQRVATQLETACAERDTLLTASTTQALLNLHRGAFLGNESETSWALDMSERLRARLLRALGAGARRLSESAEHELAIACYQRALDVDPLAEMPYRGLMTIYLTLDRRAEALVVFRRCQKLFRTELGIAPSSQTRALARRIEQA